MNTQKKYCNKKEKNKITDEYNKLMGKCNMIVQVAELKLENKYEDYFEKELILKEELLTLKEKIEEYHLDRKFHYFVISIDANIAKINCNSPYHNALKPRKSSSSDGLDIVVTKQMLESREENKRKEYVELLKKYDRYILEYFYKNEQFLKKNQKKNNLNYNMQNSYVDFMGMSIDYAMLIAYFSPMKAIMHLHNIEKNYYTNDYYQFKIDVSLINYAVNQTSLASIYNNQIADSVIEEASLRYVRISQNIQKIRKKYNRGFEEEASLLLYAKEKLNFDNIDIDERIINVKHTNFFEIIFNNNSSKAHLDFKDTLMYSEKCPRSLKLALLSHQINYIDKLSFLFISKANPSIQKRKRTLKKAISVINSEKENKDYDNIRKIIYLFDKENKQYCNSYFEYAKNLRNMYSHWWDFEKELKNSTIGTEKFNYVQSEVTQLLLCFYATIMCTKYKNV